MKFGDKLKEIRTERNLSQEQLGEIVGTSKQVISRYEANRRTPKITVAQEYADKLGVPLEYLVDDTVDLMSDVAQKVLKKLPFYNLPASAGAGEWLDGTDYEYHGFENVPSEVDFALRVRGDSMEPMYSDNDIVFVKTNVLVESGQVGVFVVGGEGYLKMLQGNKLASLNPAYAPVLISEHDSFFCAGRVVGKAEK